MLIKPRSFKRCFYYLCKIISWLHPILLSVSPKCLKDRSVPSAIQGWHHHRTRCSTSSPSVLEKTNSCAYGARRIPSSSATISLGFVDKALGHRAKKNRMASSVRPFTCRERERERKERYKETESGRERYRHTQMHTDTQLKRRIERERYIER